MAHLIRRWVPFSAVTPITRVELHLTPDIVALPPLWRTSNAVVFALVNSTNQRLEAPQFTTSEAATAFPGTNIIYPEQTVDGRVHDLGGAQLATALKSLPSLGDCSTRCATGAAVITPLRSHSTSPLAQNFEHIIHTVAPSHGAPDWAVLLASCYWSVLDCAWESATALATADGNVCHKSPQTVGVVFPLLGAGAKSVPAAAAASIAAESCASWRPAQKLVATPTPTHPMFNRSGSSDKKSTMQLELMFGVQEDEIAHEVEECFNRCSKWLQQS